MDIELEKPFLVWLDYGQEGWTYYGFDTVEKALEYIQTNSTGCPAVLTRRMQLKAEDA